MAAMTKQARPFWVIETPETTAAEARHRFEAARRALADAEKCLGRARVHVLAVQAIHSARRP